MASESRRKRATLRDVAHLSGVSYQTVSRVINGNPNVSARTRHRVQQMIKELNYRPNLAAQALVRKRAFTLELVTFGVDYFGPTQMVTGVERAARSLGYKIMFSTVDLSSHDDVQAIQRSLSGQLVDGALVITPIRAEVYDEIAQACQGLPLIEIGNEIGAKVPSVVIDQFYGSQLATQHLIDLGHRRIAAIRGPHEWHDATARYAAWVQTLQANGLAPGPVVAGDWSAASGFDAALELLDQNQPFTAVAVANDQMALGAAKAFRDYGLRIPEDISMVGFDDIPEAPYFNPPLTTVRQDLQALGRQAVEYLVQLIENPKTPPHQRVLYPRLVERSSTRRVTA